MKQVICLITLSILLVACGASYQVEPPSTTPTVVETASPTVESSTVVEATPEETLEPLPESEPEALPEETLEQPIEQPVEEQTPDVQAAVCDPSYPTICLAPPPPDINCSGISEKNFTVNQPDPHKLDTDKDGIGCEKK